MKNQSLDANFNLPVFLSGIVLGGAVGMVVALLTAPQSGRKTRAKIQEKGLELRNEAVEKIEESCRHAEEVMENLRRKSQAQIMLKGIEFRDQAAETIDEVWQGAEEAVRQMRLKSQQLKHNNHSHLNKLANSNSDRLAGKELVEPVWESS